jgi:hypothetical protein
VRRSGNVFIFLVLAMSMAAAPVAHPQSSQKTPVSDSPETSSLDSIVRHMENAQLRNRESFRPYTLTREYKLFDNVSEAEDPAQKPSSAVIANVEFVPPDQKSFQIQRVEGSARGKSIVQHILENESGKSGKTPASLTRQYYEFTLIGEERMNGHACWIVGIKPRHAEKNTIMGKAWIDKDNYLVQQVQGEIAKTPSWWLKKVEMTISYGNAAGMWLPTGTYAIADVRLFGKHVLTSQAVEIKTAAQTASASAPPISSKTQRKQLRAFPPMVGTGIYVHR